MCSTAWHSLVRDNDLVNPHRVGRNWLDKIDRMLHKYLDDRERLCPSENQFDILYADITADWERAMQGVYKFLDMPFTRQAKSGMTDWLEINRQHKHGAHKYSLAQFGLEASEVDARLMFYRERFNIPYERTNPHLIATHKHNTESA